MVQTNVTWFNTLAKSEIKKYPAMAQRKGRYYCYSHGFQRLIIFQCKCRGPERATLHCL